MQVARDHLVRLPDLDHVVDAVQLRERDRLEARGVADQPDHRVDGPTRDEGLAARGAHLLADGLDLRVGRVLLHHDDHVVLPSPGPGHPGTQNPGSGPGSLSLVYGYGDYAGPCPP